MSFNISIFALFLKLLPEYNYIYDKKTYFTLLITKTIQNDTKKLLTQDGRFDKNGDFFILHESYLDGPKSCPYISMPHFWNLERPLSVYELRDGKLIPGKLDKDYKFTHNKDQKTIPYKDYKLVVGSRLIWNFQGTIKKK